MSLVQTSKFGPQAPLPLPLVTSATAITFLPPCSGTKGLPHPRYSGFCAPSLSAPRPPAPSPRPRHSPLEGLLAALVHLKAAAVEGGVQEGHTVHRRAPGHVEDPCAEQAASGQAPAPYYPPLRHPRTAREPGAPVPGPGLSPEPTRPALTGHTGVHQRHTGPRAERPEHDLGEVTLPLGSHGGCRRTGGLRARTLQAPLPPLCASGCIC